MTSKYVVQLLAVIAALMVSNCKPTDSDKKKGGGGAQLPDANGTLPGGDGTAGACVAFVEDVQPLYQQYCVSCHAPGAQAAQWDLSTYEGASQWADRSVVRAVTQGDMPPQTSGQVFPDTAKATLQSWVNGGKIQSQAQCPTTTGTTAGDTATTAGTTTAGTTTAGTGTTSGTTTSGGDQGSGYGTAADVEYATELWLAMRRANLVGTGSAKGLPRVGEQPHGAVVSVSWGEVTVNNHTEKVFIKHNYGPAGTTVAQVLADPDKEPAAITVMFQRESNYDTTVGNKFFVQYLADGSIDENEDGTPLAGRVGKGGTSGCIPCHKNAGGNDYQYWND